MRIARKVLILALGGSTVVAGAAIALGATLGTASVIPAKASTTTVVVDSVPSPDNLVWG